MERKQKSKCVQEELQTSVEKRATLWRGKRRATIPRRVKVINDTFRTTKPQRNKKPHFFSAP